MSADAQRAARRPGRPPAATIYPALDVVRGIAALLVVLGHSRAQFEAVTGRQANALPAVWKVALLPTAWAQESVAVFFVLSGFLVGGQTLRSVSRGSFEWSVFVAKRLSRMWTVLIPGLILTAVMAWVTTATVGAPTAGPGQMQSTSWQTYACNLVFLQESRCTPPGSNDSLWSLSYEFWFYILFACGTAATFALARRRWSAALIAVVVLAAITYLFTSMVFVMAVSWLYGVAIAWLHDRYSVRLASSVVFRHGVVWALFVISAMTVSSIVGMERPVMFAFVGLPAAGLVLTLVTSGGDVPAARQSATMRRFYWLGRRLGDISYTMYVAHLPIVTLIVAVAVRSGARPSGSATVLVAYGLGVVMIPVSLAIWWLTEKRTPTVRRRAISLARRVPLRTGRRAAA